MTASGYRLVGRRGAPAVPPRLDAAQRRVVEHSGGPMVVLAGPGTGKTTTLVEAVAERVSRRGVPIENILVLTFSQRAAGELRDRITARLGTTVREPVARTFHSYAFGLLRLAADDDRPAPRLLSGAEQDVLIRELLAGDVADQRADWPSTVSPALATRGFAAQLRDLLLRAAERDVDPSTLADLGRRFGRPEWRSAAVFAQQYLDVAAQERPGAYDAAELIQAAIAALEVHPSLLARERSRRRHIFVDEYQDTDPSQTRLLSLLAAGARELVVVGDPDQSIYAFRGADPAAMSRVGRDFAAEPAGYQERTGRLFPVAGESDGLEARLPSVALTTSRRSGATLLAASRRVAERLPGPVAHRHLVAAAQMPAGEVNVRLYRSATEEAGAIAAELRRAHLDEGIAWSQMAVIVRSTARSLAVLRRALITAGVPVGTSGQDLPLAEQPAVSQLLTALRCVARPAELTEETAQALLLGSIGGADGLYLRRLRRHLRALAAGAGEPDDSSLFVPVLTGAAEVELLPARLRRAVRRVSQVLAAGRAAQADGGSAEEVLWAIWAASELALNWERRSRLGGSLGAAADRDLDAVIDLFAAAARLADRLPGATPEALYEQVLAQQVPGDTFSFGRDTGEAVQIVTAHASKGLEWDLVSVAGVQEGSWPDLRRRGSLLGSEFLVDVVAGRAEVAGLSLAPLIEEERRLFYVALTRARRRLHVSAVLGTDEQPSRFLDELDPLDDGAERALNAAPRGLHLPDLVAELRRTVTDPDATGVLRAHAARQLARLARAGVNGAAPAHWWGLAELSDERGLIEPEETAHVRPSGIHSYLTCALKTFMEVSGARESSGVRAALGSAVHEIAELAEAATDLDELERLMDQRWPGLDFGAPWYSRQQRGRASEMLQRLSLWLARSRDELTLIGRELPFRARFEDVELAGAVDRLERDRAGRAVVVDFKTGRGKPSEAELEQHPQLGAYQLAVALGGFEPGPTADAGSAQGASQGASWAPGGARLVQLAAKGALEQVQAPLGEQEDPDWIRARVREVAALQRGHRFDARLNTLCQTCPVQSVCPLKAGQQVTG